MAEARKSRLWLWLVVIPTALWLFLPSLAVIPMSFNTGNRVTFFPEERTLQLYRDFFGDPRWYEAILRSFKIGLIVTVLSVTLGTLAALSIARGYNRSRSAYLQAVVLSPVIIPVVVAAIGMYALYLQWNLVGSERALVLAHTCIAIPFVVLPVLASLRGVDPRLESAAQSLGASRASAVWHVTLPLVRPAVLVGAFLAFMQSFDEAVLSLFLTGPFTRTLPVNMFSAIVDDLDPTVAAAASVVLTLTILAVVTVGVTRVSEARG